MSQRPRRRKPDGATMQAQLVELRTQREAERKRPSTGTNGGWLRRRDTLRNLDTMIMALEAALRPPPPEDDFALPF